MSDEYFQKMRQSSHVSGTSADYIEGLYEAYQADPASVPLQWQTYFSNLPANADDAAEVPRSQVEAEFLRFAQIPRGYTPQTAQAGSGHPQTAIAALINAYRTYGHLQARLDPLQQHPLSQVPILTLAYHQLSEQDLSTVTDNGQTLEQRIATLKTIYCQSMGVEYTHMSDPVQVQWLQERLEASPGTPRFSSEKKQQILDKLVAAEGLEKYLGSRFVGQKRFGLEGGESLIPMLHHLIERSATQGMKETIIGMAHRGRLNVLVNVLGKSPQELFDSFEGKMKGSMSGDVKYHLGYSSNINTESGKVHLALAFNPSHLEIIAPVVEGSVRARQFRREDTTERKQVIPIIIHGDSAFIGQGVVMETFSFSQVRGFTTGGSVHIVINNQVGFTTSNPADTRSSLYCTDVAKIVQAPVFHVNADDPEAVLFATELAVDFRAHFHKDVVIDLVCYRRHGHNEADEPSITQPVMYAIIKNLPTVLKRYGNQLIAEGLTTQSAIDAAVLAYRDKLDQGLSIIETVNGDYRASYTVDWTPYVNTEWDVTTDMKTPVAKLQQLASKIDDLPASFTPHPVVQRMWVERRKMTAGEIPVNWGYAETLAYATLLERGYRVRLSGQDAGRGTFSHRHAALHDLKTDETYIPLQQFTPGKQTFAVIDSLLSEEAVLAFEYGYAASAPETLVIWEAQFGDFANGAQVVIDQFISSGEQKWGRLCGLVMLLPHGFEGQGPEHSSARLERYLQLCAQHNMQVCVPSTPAQIYHLLRRQMIRPYRKPLIVMTPKSLLRHKLAVSTLDELASGSYQNLIPEIDAIDPATCRRVILCAGKVYYELLEYRREKNITDMAILRIEQLYPFPKDLLTAELQRYSQAKDIVWCQEEPQNQGAWFSSQHNMQECLQAGQSLRYVGRDFFAAPAVGYLGLHSQQQTRLVLQAFEG